LVVQGEALVVRVAAQREWPQEEWLCADNGAEEDGVSFW
jgi:hypothetical protein